MKVRNVSNLIKLKKNFKHLKKKLPMYQIQKGLF